MLNICLVGNAGGHMEQLKQLRGIGDRKDCLFFITSKCPATENLEYVTDFMTAPHGRNRLETIGGYFLNTIQAIRILFRRRSDVIVSTGAGIWIDIISAYEKIRGTYQ